MICSQRNHVDGRYGLVAAGRNEKNQRDGDKVYKRRV
jgi:hypothetical protein